MQISFDHEYSKVKMLRKGDAPDSQLRRSYPRPIDTAGDPDNDFRSRSFRQVL